jgi:hypothetical protein
MALHEQPRQGVYHVNGPSACRVCTLFFTATLKSVALRVYRGCTAARTVP